MPKKTKQRASGRSLKKPPQSPILKSVFRGILRLFQEELPVTQFHSSGKYEAEVVEVKAHQPALEAICGGRSAKAQKLPTFAIISPEGRDPIMRVSIEGRPVGKLKPGDAKHLQKRLAQAEFGPCAVKVAALIVGGRRKKNGEEEDFEVRLSLPPKPQKKNASIGSEEKEQ